MTSSHYFSRITLTSKKEHVKIGSDEIWQPLLKYRYGENWAGHSAKAHPRALAYFIDRQKRLKQAESTKINSWDDNFFEYLNENMDVRLEAHVTNEARLGHHSLVSFYAIHNCPSTCPFNYLRGTKYENLRATPQIINLAISAAEV